MRVDEQHILKRRCGILGCLLAFCSFAGAGVSTFSRTSPIIWEGGEDEYRARLEPLEGSPGLCELRRENCVSLRAVHAENTNTFV